MQQQANRGASHFAAFTDEDNLHRLGQPPKCGMHPANQMTLRAFMTLWIGQLISGLGSSLSGFALGVRMSYQMCYHNEKTSYTTF